MPELVIMKWKGDNAIRSKAIRLINENGSLNLWGQVRGLNKTARQHNGKSARLTHGRPPGASRVYNTRGVGGGIRNSNATQTDSLFMKNLVQQSLGQEVIDYIWIIKMGKNDTIAEHFHELQKPNRLVVSSC